MCIMACVVSYVFIAVIAFLRAKFTFFESVPDTPLVNSGISIILGTLLSVLGSVLFSQKRFSKVMVRLFHKTPNEDIWRDILDLQNGSNLKVYIKGQDYYVIGHHKNHEENGNDSWLAVSAFGKFDKNTNSNYKNEPSYLDDESVIYTVRFSDIEHIKIF